MDNSFIKWRNPEEWIIKRWGRKILLLKLTDSCYQAWILVLVPVFVAQSHFLSVFVLRKWNKIGINVNIPSADDCLKPPGLEKGINWNALRKLMI